MREGSLPRRFTSKYAGLGDSQESRNFQSETPTHLFQPPTLHLHSTNTNTPPPPVLSKSMVLSRRCAITCLWLAFIQLSLSLSCSLFPFIRFLRHIKSQLILTRYRDVWPEGKCVKHEMYSINKLRSQMDWTGFTIFSSFFTFCWQNLRYYMIKRNIWLMFDLVFFLTTWLKVGSN